MSSTVVILILKQGSGFFDSIWCPCSQESSTSWCGCILRSSRCSMMKQEFKFIRSNFRIVSRPHFQICRTQSSSCRRSANPSTACTIIHEVASTVIDELKNEKDWLLSFQCYTTEHFQSLNRASGVKAATCSGQSGSTLLPWRHQMENMRKL